MLTLAVLAIGCYGMSLTPVTWVVIAEMFPNRVRERRCPWQSLRCGSPVSY
jgi:hypothetical protein